MHPYQTMCVKVYGEKEDPQDYVDSIVMDVQALVELTVPDEARSIMALHVQRCRSVTRFAMGREPELGVKMAVVAASEAATHFEVLEYARSFKQSPDAESALYRLAYVRTLDTARRLKLGWEHIDGPA